MSPLRVVALILFSSAALSACCCPFSQGNIVPRPEDPRDVPGPRGSGNIVTRTFDLRDFDRLEVSHGFDLTVAPAEGYSVEVRIDDNLLRYLEVYVEAHTLHIGLDSLHVGTQPRLTGSLSADALQATVTTPHLEGLKLSGGSQANVDGVHSGLTFDVEASGGGHVEGRLVLGSAHFDVSGGSDVTLSGMAADLVVDASGGSRLDLSGMQAGSAKVNAGGGSEVTVNVSGRLVAEASGGARVYYLGDPQPLTIETSGGGKVKPR